MYLLFISTDDTAFVITVPSVGRLSPRPRDTLAFTEHPRHRMDSVTSTEVENKHSSSEFFPDTPGCVLENTFVPAELAADLVSVA